MRLWSLSAEYLDQKGLVAWWRESLLAREVLRGKTKGYRNHPQLQRFKDSAQPLIAINTYLHYIYREALSRGYKFDVKKLESTKSRLTLKVSDGQLAYEFQHLLRKLENRDPARHRTLINNKTIKPIRALPLFRVVQGKIADWEKI